MARKMSRSRTGKASAFGGAVTRVSKLLSPWGKNVSKGTARGANAAGVTKSRGKAPAGSGVRRATPDASERSMGYPKNDPAMWPLEHPQVRADLGDPYAMTQHKADVHNAAVNRAYLRGTGYS